MGAKVSSLLRRLNFIMEQWKGSQKARILMLGLDGAGKTAILYKVKLDQSVNTIPTVGFNVEQVSPFKNVTLTVWDVCGQEKIRPLWRHYYKDCECLIFVVDSADHERMDEARAELYGIVDAPEMTGVPVVVIVNKQDLRQAASVERVARDLGLLNENGWQTRNHSWHIQGGCALTGEGISEAMEEVCKMVKHFKKGKPIMANTNKLSTDDIS